MQSSDPADLIWHYTSLEGLKGILSEQQIWLTDTQHLNDSSELSYSTDLYARLLGAELLPIVASSPGCSQLMENAKRLGEQWNGTGDRLYVCSLSKDGDSVSQWSMYADSCRGYALGFAPADLLQSVGDSVPSGPTRLVECIYDQSQQVGALREHIQPLISLASRAVQLENPPPARQVTALLTDAPLRFRMMATFAQIKHPSFSSEREVRLVTRAPSPLVRTRQPKAAAGLPIPFIAANLSIAQALREVRVGPYAPSGLRTDYVEQLLASFGHVNITVSQSLAPLRAN